jgi:formate-dependent nitrite reductase membrane component NrfD
MSVETPPAEARSYYGRPVIKEPVWTWEVPAYFFTGGLGGASAILGMAGRLRGNEPLAKAGLYVSAGADAVSPVLLVSDLGRPERFLNMLRVFKVTSPMSVGSWLLLVSGGASGTAALLEASGRLKALKLAAEAVSAVCGGPLATYTGGLVANTAVPAWHEARRELPYLFGAGAAASAGAAATILLPPRDAGPARRLAVAASVAGLAIGQVMEHRLGRLVAEPYRQGTAGRLNRASKLCLAAGAGVLAGAGRRTRSASVAGSALVLAGEALVRFAVWKAGVQSARDPRYTVIPQRARSAGRSAPSARFPAHEPGTPIT